MRQFRGMKVGLISLFSCLALLPGLLSPTGMASAHTANTLQSTHISSTTLADEQCTQVLEVLPRLGHDSRRKPDKDERLVLLTVCDKESH